MPMLVQSLRASPRRAYRFVIAGAAFVVAVGAWAPWGSLSVVAEQRDVVFWTRVVLAGLAVVASVACWRAPSLVGFPLAALCFVAVLGLGYGEWRYEAIQASLYQQTGSRAGLLMVLLGAFIGLITAVAAILSALRRRHAGPVAGPADPAVRRSPSKPAPSEDGRP